MSQISNVNSIMMREMGGASKGSPTNANSQRNGLSGKNKMKEIMLSNFIKKNAPHLANPTS